MNDLSTIKNKENHPPKRQGTVLIVVLLLVALVEIVVLGLGSTHSVAVAHARSFFSSLDEVSLALGGEDWAKGIVLDNYLATVAEQKPTLTGFVLPKTKIAGGTVEGYVQDMQGRFNLNNLLKFQYLSAEDKKTNQMYLAFINMMLSLNMGENFNLNTFLNLLDRKVNLINIRKKIMPPFTTVTELRAFPGINGKNFKQMMPHLAVLPGMTNLNINSATANSLLSLTPNLDLATAQQIIINRNKVGIFPTVEDFLSQETLEGVGFSLAQITVRSEYFLSTINVSYQDNAITLNSLLKVEKNNEDQYRVDVIWRSFGTL